VSDHSIEVAFCELSKAVWVVEGQNTSALSVIVILENSASRRKDFSADHHEGKRKGQLTS
jgi:hypothetical protein